MMKHLALPFRAKFARVLDVLLRTGSGAVAYCHRPHWWGIGFRTSDALSNVDSCPKKLPWWFHEPEGIDRRREVDEPGLGDELLCQFEVAHHPLKQLGDQAVRNLGHVQPE